MKMQYRKISLFILCILIQNEVLTAVAANTKPVKISASNYFTTQNDKYGKVSCIKMNGDAYAGTVKSKKKFYLASNTLNSLKADLAKALKKKKKNQAKIDKLTNQVNAKQLEVTELNQICHNVMFPPSDGSPNPTPTPEPDEPDLSDPDDYNSLEPLSRPITSEDVRYLGEKAGFGFSSREEYLTSIGVNQGVAALVENFMNTRAEDSGLMDRVNDLLDGDVGRTTTQSAYGQRAALMELQTHTNNPYAERFALFLLSVWTVSGNVITDETFRYSIWEYYNRLRNAAYDSTDLPNLGVELTRDPLMLIFLNNELNVKGKPNENFARELMELFTTGAKNLDGEANYTETTPDGLGDIAVAAKMLTGWKVKRIWEPASLTAEYVARRHQNGPHTMFAGKSYQFSGENDEDLVKGIFAHHPNVKYYYAKEILKEYLTPEPSRNLIEKFAAVIAQKNYQLRPAMAVLLQSKAFYDNKYKNTLPKNSIEFAVETIRTLKMENAFDQGEAGRLVVDMGMPFNDAPSVFWFNPQAWTGPSILLERTNFIASLLGDSTAQNKNSPAWTAAKILPTGSINNQQLIDSVKGKLGIKTLNNNDTNNLYSYLSNQRQWDGTYESFTYDNNDPEHQQIKGAGLYYILSAMPDYQLK